MQAANCDYLGVMIISTAAFYRQTTVMQSLNQRSTLTVFPLADFLPLLMASLMKYHFSASRIDGGLVKTLGDASLVGLITLGITGRSVA